MSFCNCSVRCSCTAAAFLLSLFVGIVTAFLQITAVITVAPAFLWVALGIAIVYLAVLVIAAALAGRAEFFRCACNALNTVLLGILGTVFFALVLLAVGIVATSMVSAILVGLLLLFLSLTVTGTVCFVRYLAGCGSCA